MPLLDAYPRQMEREKEAFGFYFAAHPLFAICTRSAASHGARRPMPKCMDSGPIAEGVRRKSATHGGLMVRGHPLARVQAQGQPLHVLADLSDTSGQFSARCFEDALEPATGGMGQGCALACCWAWRLDHAPWRRSPGNSRSKAPNHCESLVSLHPFQNAAWTLRGESDAFQRSCSTSLRRYKAGVVKLVVKDPRGMTVSLVRTSSSEANSGLTSSLWKR